MFRSSWASWGLFHPDVGNPVVALINGVLFSFLWVTLTALFSAVAGLVYDFTLHGHGPAVPNNG